MAVEKNKKSSKRIFILLVGGLIVLTIVLFVVAEYFDSNNKLSFIQNLSHSVEISSVIFLIASAIIAFREYSFSVKNERAKNNTEKINKAIELAKYYKDTIIPKYSFITYVFRETGIQSIIDTIDKSKMNRFDLSELKSNLSKEDIEELKNKLRNPNTIYVVYNAINIYGMRDAKLFNQDMSSYVHSNEEKDQEEETELIKKIENFIIHEVAELLNDLEYFALYFTHKSADNSVVYQSLHQTYLCAIEKLYYHISRKNEYPYEKYYTNIIKLYSEWKETYNNKKAEYEKSVEKQFEEHERLQERGTISETV